MKNKKILNLVLAAMFLALGIVLPLFTGQIKQIGNMLLPMHIPVMLCGLICGWQYGAVVGCITPLLRSALFSMPVMFPNAFAMAFELATYGLVIGLLFSHSKQKSIKSIYISLLAAMVSGRIVWGIVEMLILGLGEGGFTLTMFVTSSFLNAIPGIILQIILIPVIMLALSKTKLVELKVKRADDE